MITAGALGIASTTCRRAGRSASPRPVTAAVAPGRRGGQARSYRAAGLLTTLTATRLGGSGLPSGSATRIAGQAVQGEVAGAHRAALAAGFTGALHTLGLVLAALSTPGAVLTCLAPAPGAAASHR
ncbi:hypothetical protein [Streptacidiphilus albus]|nr:hypothetical protein [Streptacidiphilus albus]